MCTTGVPGMLMWSWQVIWVATYMHTACSIQCIQIRMRSICKSLYIIPEIENAGNSAPELYSSKPVRKQPPVWTMELLTITSPEMLNFLTKRWTGMHMNTCSSISLQIMNGQIEFLTTTTKYFLKSGNVQTSENVYFLEKTTAGCPADRTQLLKIFWSNSESFQANFNI